MDVRRAIRRVPLGAWVGGLAVAAALGVAAGADASPMPEPPAPPPPARRAWPAAIPAPDAERRDGTTTPVEVIQDPGPGGRETDEQSLLATSSPAVAPTARTLRLVRSGRRAVVAFTLGTPFRVRATVHRAGRRVARLAERRMAAGRRAMGLGALPPGRYRVVMELRGADGSARITRTLRLKAVPRRR